MMDKSFVKWTPEVYSMYHLSSLKIFPPILLRFNTPAATSAALTNGKVCKHVNTSHAIVICMWKFPMPTLYMGFKERKAEMRTVIKCFLFKQSRTLIVSVAVNTITGLWIINVRVGIIFHRFYNCISGCSVVVRDSNHINSMKIPIDLPNE